LLSITTTLSVGNSAFFVVHPSSPQVNLECAFPEGTTDVEWLSDGPETPHFKDLKMSSEQLKKNVVVLSLFLNTEDSPVFTCKGVDSSGHVHFQQYTVILDSK